MNKLKVLELFSGIGSQAKAIKRLGIDAEFTQCEIDKYAISSYNAIHRETKNLGDITKINENNLYKDQWDLITYSFPCQAISQAGLQKGLTKNSGTTSSLLWEVEKFINKVRPKYLLMENVKALVGKKFINDFYKWLKLLNDYGYNNYWQVLNAKDYGVPQNRERVFCVSIRKDLKQGYEFPKKEPLKIYLSDLLEKEVDEKYYLSNKMVKYFTNENTGKVNRKEQFLRNFKSNKKDIANTITTINGSRATDTFIGTYQFNKSDKFMNEKDRLQTSQKEAMVFNNLKIRKLTPLECFLLMGFDIEDYEKVKAIGMSDCQMYKQCGNSIVVNVLEKIFYNLFIDKKEYDRLF